MIYTQVELTHGDHKEVWWLPVLQGQVNLGDIVMRDSESGLNDNDGDWVVTGVFTSLDYTHIPSGCRVADSRHFKREVQKIGFMSIAEPS